MCPDLLEIVPILRLPLHSVLVAFVLTYGVGLLFDTKIFLVPHSYSLGTLLWPYRSQNSLIRESLSLGILPKYLVVSASLDSSSKAQYAHSVLILLGVSAQDTLLGVPFLRLKTY